MAWEEAKVSSTKLPKGMPLVCICVPHHGSVSLEWVQSTWGPLYWVPQADFAKTSQMSRGIMNLDTERNLLAKQALKNPRVTHILWLDTDNICETPQDPNQALRLLLGCNAPVVSGLYRAKKQGAQYPYCIFAKGPIREGIQTYIPIPEWTGNWIKADVIGMGFCLMKREVFEKVPYPWFVWDKRAPSEDFDFCEKLAKYGYEIKVFTDVRLSHAGMLKVKTDGTITTLDV